MNPQENIPLHIKRRIHLIDKVIDNLLPNMYPCDYNSSDHFVEGVLDELFYFLEEEPDFYGIDLISINDFILDHKYDELTDYFHEHCIVLKNDNLQESIRRILKEENKKSALLRAIEEDGLYEVMKDTGLSLKKIKSKIGELPREVFERYVKDFLENDEIGLDLSIQISPNKIVDSFYLSDGVVTIELNEVDSRNRVVAGSFERLSALSDEEIFSLVDEMSQINFDNYFDLW